MLYTDISDIDECQTENGNCTQLCNNTAGSYHCECWDGYEMINDSICIGELHKCYHCDQVHKL